MKSKGSKGFKKFMAMAYGIGGAIVIIGALFKILHLPGGNLMLILGLGTEAFIFFMSAFEPLPSEELDWTLVYPELVGGQSGSAKNDKETPQGIMSSKIDEMFAASKLDVEKISKLTSSIENFSKATKVIGESSSSISGTEEYNKQISQAASQLAKMNNMYESQGAGLSEIQKAQDEVLKNQSNMIKSVAEKSSVLTQQMDDLSNNISSLNNVYGGMLSAMGKK